MKVINSHIQKCQAWIKLQQAASKSKHLELWLRETLKAEERHHSIKWAKNNTDYSGTMQASPQWRKIF